MLREGAHASFIGQEDNGREVGDRCLVLTIERRHSNVRWVTGSKLGAYEAVLNTELVADLEPRRFEDEFTFETFSNRIVNVACRVIHDAKGDEALLRAVAQEGHLAELGEVAQRAVALFREALYEDPAWAEVQADLGEAGLQFERFAIRHFLVSALREVEGVPQEAA